MVMKNKLFLIFSMFLLVFTLSFISAQPQTTVYTFPEGYTIVPIKFQTLKLNEDVTFNAYIRNSSTGLKLDNTTIECNFHLADSQGNMLLDDKEIYQPNGFWTTTINGSYFNETGYYYYGVDCEDGLGGSYTEVLKINPTGEEFTVSKAIIIFGLSLIILILFILCIKGLVLVDNFGWSFGFLNIGYLLLNIFFYYLWKSFDNYILNFVEITAGLHAMWIVSNILWIPFILGQVAYILLKITEESQINKLVKMGYTQDEAISRSRKRNKR